MASFTGSLLRIHCGFICTSSVLLSEPANRAAYSNGCEFRTFQTLESLRWRPLNRAYCFTEGSLCIADCDRLALISNKLKFHPNSRITSKIRQFQAYLIPLVSFIRPVSHSASISFQFSLTISLVCFEDSKCVYHSNAVCAN